MQTICMGGQCFKNYLVSEPNYYTTKWFSECLLAIEMKKIGLYESREEVAQLFNNYAKNMSKNIYKSKQGT